MGSVKRAKCHECGKVMNQKHFNQKYHPSCKKKVQARHSHACAVRNGRIKSPGVGSGKCSPQRTTCEECGRVMIKKAHTQKYHPSCAEKVDKRQQYESAIRSGRNKNPGMGGGWYKPHRAKCTQCGNGMIKRNGRQKYCASCKRKMVARRSYGYAVQAGRIKNPGRGSNQPNENSSNWKYGARPWQVKNFRGTKCERCGSKGQMHLHHRDGDWRNWNPENLETLCVPHHQEEHGGEIHAAA